MMPNPRMRLLGFAASVFLDQEKSGVTQQRLRPVFLPFSLVVALLTFAQVLGVPSSVGSDGYRHLVIVGFLALDMLAFGLCSFWFWLIYDDHDPIQVHVRPLLIGSRIENMKLRWPELHPARIIMIATPVMLSMLYLILSLFQAQVGALLLATFADPMLTLISMEKDCNIFGDADQRLFLAQFATFLGYDQVCLKVAAATPMGATFMFLTWLLKTLFGAVLFVAFVQFGGQVMRRPH